MDGSVDPPPIKRPLTISILPPGTPRQVKCAFVFSVTLSLSFSVRRTVLVSHLRVCGCLPVEPGATDEPLCPGSESVSAAAPRPQRGRRLGKLARVRDRAAAAVDGAGKRYSYDNETIV